MNTEQKKEFIFHVVKYWASAQIQNKKSWVNPERYDNFQQELKHDELADARCLLRMIFKEVDLYNAKIKAKVTLLENLKFKRNWEDSSCFNGLKIPWKKIDQLIAENPTMEVYQIYRLLIDLN